MDFNFKKEVLSFNWHISKTTHLEIAHNDSNNWFVYFRQNNEKGVQDDYVLLRNDLKYVHELQNIIISLKRILIIK